MYILCFRIFSIRDYKILRVDTFQFIFFYVLTLQPTIFEIFLFCDLLAFGFYCLLFLKLFNARFLLIFGLLKLKISGWLDFPQNLLSCVFWTSLILECFNFSRFINLESWFYAISDYKCLVLGAFNFGRIYFWDL